MFGVAVASISSLSEEEKARYQELYCGLCFALKDLYGLTGQVTLNYDLTFLAVLYNSLYEPEEIRGSGRCVAHLKKKASFARTEFTDYCADLSLVLAYHKCLDDVADEGGAKAKVSVALMDGAYEKAKRRVSEQCDVVSFGMEAIRAMENSPESPPDATANAFGEVFGFLVECVPGAYPDIWSDSLRRFGRSLGRFIYLMDAAVDFKQDKESGCYNPFTRLWDEPDAGMMRDILSAEASIMCDIFERLPLVQDANLMRSVLYSGVWQKFNQTYRQ